MLAVPASFDFFGTTLMFVALTMCAASIYQMMRGIIVVVTAGMAMAFLGRKQYFHHYFSLFLIVSAVAIVGVVGILISNKQNSEAHDADAPPPVETKPFGLILLVISQFFTGGQFVFEEKLLSGYYLDPLLVVGLEGMWGCIFYAIVLPIFQHLTNNNICEKSDFVGSLCNYGYLEDSKLAFS